MYEAIFIEPLKKSLDVKMQKKKGGEIFRMVRRILDTDMYMVKRRSASAGNKKIQGERGSGGVECSEPNIKDTAVNGRLPARFGLSVRKQFITVTKSITY